LKAKPIEYTRRDYINMYRIIADIDKQLSYIDRKSSEIIRTSIDIKKDHEDVQIYTLLLEDLKKIFRNI